MDLMAGAGGPLEPAELRLRAQMIDAGVWVTYVICGALGAWTVVTWQRPHRPALLILLAFAVAAAFAISKLPREPILASRWREAFFLTWSILDIALIALVAALDGGARSPTTVVFFLTVVFAALSYPLATVVLVSVLNLAAFLALAIASGGSPGGHLDGGFIWLFATCLALASAMCVWHARIHGEQRQELARASRTDPLTGSLNRRGIEERIDHALDQAAAGGLEVALIVFDIDGFKAVNDTFGHAAGDELLCWAVRTAHGVLRPEHSLGRLGGDEFALVLPGTDGGAGIAVARRVKEALAERLSVAVGIAVFPQHGTERAALHRHADGDLYTAKRARAAVVGALDLDGPGPLEIGIDALSAALAARDRYTGEHSEQVLELASLIARELELPDAEVREVEQVARLHDLGKLGMPDAILQKPGPLDETEWAAMREHPAIGAHILASIAGLGHLAPLVRAEHERWDGGGYPDGLAGEQIPRASRIVFAADAYHAMTSDRPYRKALSPDAVRRELEEGAGSQFDPQVVVALTAVLERRGEPAGYPSRSPWRSTSSPTESRSMVSP